MAKRNKMSKRARYHKGTRHDYRKGGRVNYDIGGRADKELEDSINMLLAY